MPCQSCHLLSIGGGECTFAVLTLVASAQVVAGMHHTLVVGLLIECAATIDDASRRGDADVESVPSVLGARVGRIRVVALS